MRLAVLSAERAVRGMPHAVARRVGHSRLFRLHLEPQDRARAAPVLPVAERIGPELSAQGDQWLKRLQLVPKSEVTRLQTQIDELTLKVAELEARLAQVMGSGR